ncbi:diguanylate cyclase (GGDEF) domain-containing protein [Tindallia magadiensis]|uniref:Diguanylate cyclase (GGDEF) domain-containing protein n=1 Tax=Tindallia magadiensis TaxID=69895 RepID=A0A1I3CEU9_9FIRM|nr:GGDEF domain-containing protein [Tindallia magadiensis]SFH73005.1 diguanylate cyclase (GGDEF) domain-containing protein [Tindallia magadiensis]
MDYYHIANRFLWLYSLSVSFSILVMAINFPYQHKRERLLGAIFAIPFSGYLLSGLLFTPGLQIDQVYWLAEVLMLTGVMMVYLGLISERINPITLIVTTAVMTGILFLSIDKFAADFLGWINYRTALWFFWIPGLVIFTKIRQSKDAFYRFHYGLLMIGLAYTVQFFRGSLYVPEVSLLLKIVGYSLLLIHFSSTMEKEIKMLQRSVDNYQRRLQKTADNAAKRKENELMRSHQAVLENAKKDGLTGAFNRISIMDFIDEQIKQNDGTSFSVLMFDIDKFKRINDNLGHVKGDIALKTLASITQGVIREYDYLGRYGGDEFIVLLPKLNLAESRLVAERLLEKIRKTKEPHFTISIGISVFPEDGETVLELIQIADKGLYKSKEKGGNDVSHHEVF